MKYSKGADSMETTAGKRHQTWILESGLELMKSGGDRVVGWEVGRQRKVLSFLPFPLLVHHHASGSSSSHPSFLSSWFLTSLSPSFLCFSPFFFPFLQPYEDRARRWLFASQEKGPHQELNLPTPWSWMSQTVRQWEKNACYSSHVVCVFCCSSLSC